MTEQWVADSTTYKIDYWWETQVLGKGGVVAVARSMKEVQTTQYAKLIAAAPEMYEALLKLHSIIDFTEPVSASGRLGYVDDPSAMNEAFKIAVSALAKADGRQP